MSAWRASPPAAAKASESSIDAGWAIRLSLRWRRMFARKALCGSSTRRVAHVGPVNQAMPLTSAAP